MLVFILGGSGLIGSEIVNKMQSISDKTIILDIKKPKIIDNKKIEFIKFDCSRLKNIDKSLSEIINKKGIPDVFINASYPTTKDWIKCDFKRIKLNYLINNINIHLNSYCWSSKIMAEKMKKKKSSSIILLSSIYGVIAQDPNLYKKTNLNENMVYPIIKGAIISHCRQLASIYGSYNLRINCISPGGIKGDIKGKKNKQNKLFKKKYLNKVPLNRFCKPEDIAEMCVFLSLPRSSYITGQNLILDGGLSII